MADQNHSATPGLLSKVTRFVRKPASEASVPDAAESAPTDSMQEAAASKEALKKMIERKRRNDAVRKLEFDELRRLRNAAPVTRPQGAEDSSLFPMATDLSDLDEKATTLKKIDEIESQMAQQWWRVSPPAAEELPTRPVTLPAAPEPDLEADYVSTQPVDALPLDEVMTTQAVQPSGAELSLPPRPLGLRPTPAARGFDAGVDSVFSASKMESIDLGQSLSNPVLEEAAIRYANGDAASAEQALLEAIRDAHDAPERAGIWIDALFDLYCCTGQHDAFDRLALQVKQQFGRAAPAWQPLAPRPAPADHSDFSSTLVLPTEDGGGAREVALAGELLGDCEPLLASFPIPSQGCLIVACDELARVDFSAAGCLLNWAARVESTGGRIEFRNVHRLVAAFFNLIGIHECARVVPRAG